MKETELDATMLKRLLKESLVETLHEQREVLHEVFAEALEDFAMAEAIRIGRETEPVSREEVFRTFEGRS